MSEKRDRDPFADRYDGKSNTSKSSDASKTSKSEETERTPLRERTNINMYIEDESLVEQLKREYKRLDLDWSEEFGDDLPKNDEFYPAVLRAALNETSIREELGLD